MWEVLMETVQHKGKQNIMQASKRCNLGRFYTRIVQGTRFDWVGNAEKCGTFIWFGPLE